jgi:hypothetical protein
MASNVTKMNKQFNDFDITKPTSPESHLSSFQYPQTKYVSKNTILLINL